MPDGTPNYLTISESGDVTAEFSGGIQILRGETDPLPDEPQANRAVKWVRESDGGLVAYDTAAGTTALDQNKYSVVLDPNLPDSNFNYIKQGVSNPPGGATNYIELLLNDPGGNGGLLRLLSNGQQSDLVQKERFMQNPVSGLGASPSGNFTIDREGPVYVLWQGTAYSALAGVLRYIDLKIDGVTVDSAGKFINVANNHETFPWEFYQSASLSVGVHTAQIVAGASGSVRDANDWNCVVVVQP